MKSAPGTAAAAVAPDRWVVAVRPGRLGLVVGWLYTGLLAAALGLFLFGACGWAVHELWSGKPLSLNLALSLALGPIGLVALRNMARALGSLLLPPRTSTGVIEEVREVKYSGVRIDYKLLHVTVSGRTFASGRSAVHDRAALVVGRPARVQVARDGELVLLEVDRHPARPATRSD